MKLEASVLELQNSLCATKEQLEKADFQVTPTQANHPSLSFGPLQAAEYEAQCGEALEALGRLKKDAATSQVLIAQLQVTTE